MKVSAVEPSDPAILDFTFDFISETLRLYVGLREGALKTLPLLLLLLVAAAPVAAQPLDPSQEALDATLRMLRDPALRGPVVSVDPQASGIDSQVQAMIGGSPELAQDVYELAARIFSELTQTTGGDVAKMRETLERAKRDPAGFAALLSPATLERLRALAVKISDRPR